MKTPLVLTAALGCLLFNPLAASYQITEEKLGPATENGTLYTLSPKGMHVATVSAKGSRFVVTVDGVESPPFDEIMKATGELELRYDSNLQPVQGYKWQGPVAFSPDGRRHAYVARIDKELLVMLDGKEIYRAPYSLSFPSVAHLFFSPDGKRLFFYARTTDTMQSHQLMIDGKVASPAFIGNPAPFFSSDGSRWGLLAARAGSNEGLFLLIDGKDAGYIGVGPQFTPDGKRVVSVRRSSGEPQQALLVDGKPLFAADLIESYAISATGDIAAIASPAAGPKQLYLNGKPVPGTENVSGVIFSPDGKRWAAWCASHPSSWVVVDGKRQQNYTRVYDVAFSPDSSKIVYVAETGVKKFVVVDGREDNGSANLLVRPFFADTGHALAYAVSETNALGSRRVILDGGPQPLGRNVRQLTLSADGKRHAYYLASDALVSRLIIDGEEIGGANAEGDQVLFSPDSRTVVALARPPQPQEGRSLYANGNFISSKELPIITILGFTPDSRHLLTTARESTPTGGQNVQVYRLNGQVVAEFANRGVPWVNSGTTRVWEAQPDGSILLVGPTANPNGTAGPMKRVRVVPEKNAPDLTAWTAEVAAERERARAAAAAEKAQAEADRIAAANARKQAQADAAAARAAAKAEADAARAKKKADAAAAKGSP